jgi:hypothetical protein
LKDRSRLETFQGHQHVCEEPDANVIPMACSLLRKTGATTGSPLLPIDSAPLAALNHCVKHRPIVGEGILLGEGVRRYCTRY